jgi:hypothetical protein
MEHPAESIEVAGYRACRCGELVLTEIALRTQGLCVDCYHSEHGDRLVDIEVRLAGARVHTPTKYPRPPTSKGNLWTKKAAEKANKRAMLRLRGMFPDLYDILRAEERGRVGLDPWPVERVLEPDQAGPTVEESVDFAALVNALDAAGITGHGISAT